MCLGGAGRMPGVCEMRLGSRRADGKMHKVSERDRDDAGRGVHGEVETF